MKIYGKEVLILHVKKKWWQEAKIVVLYFKIRAKLPYLKSLTRFGCYAATRS